MKLVWPQRNLYAQSYLEFSSFHLIADHTHHAGYTIAAETILASNNGKSLQLHMELCEFITTTLGYETTYSSDLGCPYHLGCLTTVHGSVVSHDVSLCVTVDRNFSMTLCITGTLHSRNTQVLRATMAL